MYCEQQHVSLGDILDRLLNKGVVISGELVISVADIDLLFLDLRLLITSVETAIQMNCPTVREMTGSHPFMGEKSKEP